MSISKKKLMKANELMPVPNDAELLVTRNTAGNQLPGFTQRMTVKEAIKYGAWDTVQGTMSYQVNLVNSQEYDPPVFSGVFLFQGTPVVRLKREGE